VSSMAAQVREIEVVNTVEVRGEPLVVNVSSKH
jgi:hypothetical protein